MTAIRKGIRRRADNPIGQFIAPSKYGAIKTVVDGVTFDSKAEARRYGQLIALERVGHISHLERQVVYVLAPAVILGGRKKPALRYVADFRYFDTNTQKTITEDVKGVITPLFRVKQHLMKHIHEIEVRVTK